MSRGALLGYGHVAAEGHLPVWRRRDDVRIVAVADAADARRELFLGSDPDGRAYPTAEALLAAEPLDFVDVCTPPSSHAQGVRQALDAGLHVLCEKPLTISAADAVDLATRARAAGKVVHVVHNWLAAPVCRKISELLARGAVGRVRSIEWTTLRTQPAVAVGGAEAAANWRLDPLVAGGGILFDHGWHAAYCVAHWAGGPPRRVAARMETRRFQTLAVEDTATLDLDYGDVSGSIHLTWAAERRANTISIVGDDARIEVQGPDLVLRGRSGEQVWTCPPALSEGSHHPDWFAAVADAFRLAMAGRGPSNLDEAVMCAQVMDAATRSSAAGGGWVAIPRLTADSAARLSSWVEPEGARS